MSNFIEAVKRAHDVLQSGELLCEVTAVSILREAIAAEEARADEAVVWTDSLERVCVRVRRSDDRAKSSEGVKELFKIPLYTHPTPPPSADHPELVLDMVASCEPKPASEREAYIQQLRKLARNSYAEAGKLFTEAADMLAADASSAARERHTRGTLRNVLAGIGGVQQKALTEKFGEPAQQVTTRNDNAAFNAAINFAIGLTSLETKEFLMAWRDGDTSEWPEFTNPAK